MTESSAARWFCFFLLGTVLAGLMLRWQLAGFSTPTLTALDWRRAHSHLGFYGVLFPLTWICFRSFGAWMPSKALWTFYGALVTLGGFAFLFQGYGFFSILASTGILSVWLVFAWKNRTTLSVSKKDWLAPAPYSIVAAAFLIPFVAFLTHRDPNLANEVARAFLTLLLFGVFVPATLRLLNASPPRAWAWFMASVAAALYLTSLASSPLFGGGLVWLGFEISRSLFVGKNNDFRVEARDVRLLLAWGALAASLTATGLGLLPYSYYQAIAGIHFLILGPLLMTFALIHWRVTPHPILRGFYELSLLTMVASISLQTWVSFSLYEIAAFSGTALVLSLIAILSGRFFQTR